MHIHRHATNMRQAGPLSKIKVKELLPGRARRFDLRVPFRFRVQGDDRWRKGHIENISRSGVLFRSRDTLGPRTRLEMCFELPAVVAGGVVSCRGMVVRVLPLRPGRVKSLAATISSFRLAPSLAVGGLLWQEMTAGS